MTLIPVGIEEGGSEEDRGKDREEEREIENFIESRISLTELRKRLQDETRSEERRVGKSVDLGGRRIIKKKIRKINVSTRHILCNRPTTRTITAQCRL